MNRLKKTKQLLTMLFFIALGIKNLHAQTHVNAAANCILHDNYVKEASKTKNTVSCVDCYCRVCGDKKEKEAKKKGGQTKAKQIIVVTQKKTTPIKGPKVKSDQVILTSPKLKLEENKNPIAKLSTKDLEIIELGKKTKVIMEHFAKDGVNVFDGALRDSPESVCYVFYKENGRDILLKDFKLKEDDWKDDYSLSGGKIDENGNFCVMYVQLPKSRVQPYSWSDIITIKGERILNDKSIWVISYRGNGIYDLKMQGQTKPTEQYNFKTKKRTTIE